MHNQWKKKRFDDWFMFTSFMQNIKSNKQIQFNSIQYNAAVQFDTQ